jgi:hypothetical protein
MAAVARDALAKARLFVSRLATRPRRFHAYCVGTPKSGTVSIWGLFAGQYRARHEPEAKEVIEVMDGAVHGRVDPTRIARFFRERDKRLLLELESSHPTAYFLETLVREFGDAKFILTIRDCYSWLESVFGQQLSLPRTGALAFYGRMRDAYYRPDLFHHAPEERVLAERGLYTLDGYLSYWASHYSRALTLVPPERLLVVRTREIERDIEKIAAFVGVSAESLTREQSHLNRAATHHALLSRIDREFVEKKVDRYCRPLMARFYPEIRRIEDVLRA